MKGARRWPFNPACYPAVALVGVFGYYASVAMTLKVLSVRRDTEKPLPFMEPG